MDKKYIHNTLSTGQKKILKLLGKLETSAPFHEEGGGASNINHQQMKIANG